MTKDNASKAGMETVAWFGRVDHHTGISTPTEELVRRTDATRLLAESQAHNAKLEAQVERLRLALESVSSICDETRAARDLQPRMTEIRGLARAALKP